MCIKQLWIQNLRVLESVNIEPSPSLNIICGDNASGKTSLLEAIYFLSAARSFRSSQSSELIRHQHDHFVIGAKNTRNQFAIKRSRKNLVMKANGEILNRVADLAKFSAVQIIHPDSHHLVTGSSKARRQFLDWGLFHVEHGFYPVWLRYQRALKQRNVLLRQFSSSKRSANFANISAQQYQQTFAPWDNELSKCASLLHEYRQNYFAKFNQLLPSYVQAINTTNRVEIKYFSGWDDQQVLANVLKVNYDKDKQRGFTSVGAHRADLILKVNGYKAQNEISRGQQKMLVSALILTQASLYQQYTNKMPCILIDDLPAELDKKHQAALFDCLKKMQAQLFITCIHVKDLDFSSWQQQKMFHVEHGNVQQVL